MKPVQIGLLVIAGALGGALVMTVVQRPKAVPVQITETPAAAPVQPVEPAPAPAAVPEPPPPTPAEMPAETARPVPPKVKPKPRPSPPPANPRPEPVLAQQQPPAAAPSQPAAVEPSPQPISPARPEPEHVTPPPPPPPEPNRATLNTGTLIPVRLVDGLSTERNMPGDRFTATLDHELVADGFVLAERGARVEGRVVASDRGGKVRGVALLAVELTRIRTSDGQNVAIQTESFQRQAAPTHGQDAAKVGAGAAIGAVIGAIAGGGKGAAIGAGVGGAAGAGDVALTRGQAATLPSETRLSFRLRAPVTVTERR